MEEFRPCVMTQLPTRWLETDNPAKLQALEKSGLKAYIEKAESIRPVLGRVGHLVEEFWENFRVRCSTVFGYKISVKQQDICRATGLPNKGRGMGYWFLNKSTIIKENGEKAWKERHARKLTALCGVETKFMHELPVDSIKDDTTRYVASLVMEHLAGIPTVSQCNHGFLDAIEEGMNGNITNWSVYICKKMKTANQMCRKDLISPTMWTKYGVPYGVVIALLVRDQAPDLWQQVVENGGQDAELLKKRRMNEVDVVRDIELLKERRMNEGNRNGFELGNLKGQGKIEGSEGYQHGEKRQKLSLALENLGEERGREGSEGVQMQEAVERMDGLDYVTACSILRKIKAGLAQECAEIVEQCLADREEWIEATALEVSDGELLEQYYSGLNFHSGAHVVRSRMHGIPKSLLRRFSGRVRSEQRKVINERRVRKCDKLLVISVEYVLAHFVHKSKAPFAHGGFSVDPYIVFVHPQTSRFLWSCMSVFKVVLWSEKPRNVHDLVLKHILKDITSSDQILSYSIEDCIMTRISRTMRRLNRKGYEFYGCYKDLTNVWEDLGDYSSANTLLVDTSNVALLRNQDGNVICPIPYQYNVQASFWQLENCILPYLERLESVEGVSEFVKNFPFGLEKGYTWARPQFEEDIVTPLFAIPCPPPRRGVVKNWKIFPSIVTETSNSQLDLSNTQCVEISNTGQQFPIARTSISCSESIPPDANLEILEMHNGNTSRVSLGFNDGLQSENNMNYIAQLIKQSDDNVKNMKELIQAKIDLQNTVYERDKLEKKLQEKEEHLQNVVNAFEELNEQKKMAEDENADLSKAFVERNRALEQVKLEKTLAVKQKENIICSLQETVQALQEKLGNLEQKDREFQILINREKETAQICSTLTDVLGLKQGEDLVVGAQKLIRELRQQWKVKHKLKPDQFMLVSSPDVQQSTEESYQQSNNQGATSHMNGDKSTGARSHLLLTSDTEALHCSICMEEWTTAGDHRIWILNRELKSSSSKHKGVLHFKLQCQMDRLHGEIHHVEAKAQGVIKTPLPVDTCLACPVLESGLSDMRTILASVHNAITRLSWLTSEFFMYQL